MLLGSDKHVWPKFTWMIMMITTTTIIITIIIQTTTITIITTMPDLNVMDLANHVTLKILGSHNHV